MSHEPLIIETRAGLIENIHEGLICGVNDQLKSIHKVGDEEQYVYYRSASKPIQAIPAFMSGIVEKYQLTDEEAALFTASQRGETYHIAALESLLEKLPAKEDYLHCAASLPLNQEPRDEMIRNKTEKRRLYHNCAGKHLGFLAVCHELGYPVEGYWEIDHPLQQELLSILATLAEIPVSKIKVGVDGCGVPVFAIPLKNMAITYLKLACPDLIEDEAIRNAVVKMVKVMNEHPDIVASEHFVCSVLLRDENIVAKGGAQGVYCFGLKRERIAFALKVLSGSEAVWPNILASILEQINYSNKSTINALQELRPAIVKNDAGIEVGQVQTAFSLKNLMEV
ncbi:asparaginase [Bacillus niameyensis]|uniref:asparaginase n=1 Tax=Bacillus niameyensis TaxID=1522308 RepID=UPI00078484BD|nr:asparaginase [Bacillus niameyensis]